MATSVFEKPRSRSGDADNAELLYVVLGTASDADARDALEDAAPATHNGLTRRRVHVEPIHVVADDADACMWDGLVRYARVGSTLPETGESVYSFDTGGGTQHVACALEHIQSYPAPGRTAPNHQGAIGVTQQGVEGVDIIVPVYHFSETHYLAAGVVDQAYKLVLFGLTGTVNDGAFRGFAAGEVLFLGASGSKRSDADWEVTFRFAASPNRTNFSVGPITVASKKGWEYLWIEDEETVDDAADRIVHRPLAAHVERVYDDGDFSGLGI